MTDRAAGRKTALVALSAMAFLLLAMLSPAAHAQIPGVEIPGVDLGGGGNAGGGSGGSGGGDSGGSGGGGSDNGPGDGLVGSVVDKVADVTDDTTNPVGEVVEETGQNLGNDKVEDAGKTLGNTTKDAGRAVSDVGHSVDDTLNNVGGGVLNPDLLVNDPRDPKKREENGSKGSPGTPQGGNSDSKVKGDRLAAQRHDLKVASLKVVETKRQRNLEAPTQVASPAPPVRETFITQLADAAVEATKKLAFPLGLALMVGAFLIVQGRIDRKDAKLALAPINSEQDLLSFQ